jgi:hypothetical protein
MFTLRFAIAAIFAALVPAVFAFGLLASVRIVHNSPINPLATTLPRPQLTEIPDWKQYYMQASLRVGEPAVAETQPSEGPMVVAPPLAEVLRNEDRIAAASAVVARAALNPTVVAAAVVTPPAVTPVLVPSELEASSAPPVEEPVVAIPPPSVMPAPAPVPVRAEEDTPRVDQIARRPAAPAEPPAMEPEEKPPTKAGKRTRTERKAAAKAARTERLEKLRAKRRAAAAARRQVVPTVTPFATPNPYAQPAPYLPPAPYAQPAPFPR